MAETDVVPLLLELRDEVSTVKATVARIEIQTTATNGRVSRHDEWMAAHDQAVAVAAAGAAGRREQRRDDLAKVEAAQAFLKEWIPLLIAGAVGGVGVASFILGGFLP